MRQSKNKMVEISFPSRDCERLAKEGRPARRRDDGYARNSRRYSRYGRLLIVELVSGCPQR